MKSISNISKGYKKTKVGIIPSEWEVTNLGSLVEIQSGNSPNMFDLENGGEIPYIKVDDLNNSSKYQNSSRYQTKLSKGVIPINSILFPKRGAAILNNKVRINKVPIQMDSNMMAIYPKTDKINYEYLYYKITFQKLFRIADTSTIPQINNKHILPYRISLPPLQEQHKIAEILSTWDKAISTQSQILIESLNRKKGLEQKILSGKNRFQEFIKSHSLVKTPVGELPEDWELQHISDITLRVKKSINPEPETIYREIGIRSHCKGIFHKEEVTGASLGNKSVFWIQPDCFVVNIVFAWEHAIAKTTEAEVGMIASHRFPMYKPKKGVLDLDYLLYYFKTARGKHLLGLASPGGAGRNKTLGQGEFAKLKIPVPSLAEQKRIVAVLSEADREIELLKQQIANLKEQKKGLMQKLLTGEIRVKTNNKE